MARPFYFENQFSFTYQKRIHRVLIHSRKGKLKSSIDSTAQGLSRINKRSASGNRGIRCSPILKCKIRIKALAPLESPSGISNGANDLILHFDTQNGG